jgi:hypothetical protein
MELAWLANEKPAIAIVIDKDTRTKVATTRAIDREQIFRRMTGSPKGEPIEPLNFGVATTFQRFNMPSRGFIVSCGRGVTVPNKDSRKPPFSTPIFGRAKNNGAAHARWDFDQLVLGLSNQSQGTPI